MYAAVATMLFAQFMQINNIYNSQQLYDCIIYINNVPIHHTIVIGSKNTLNVHTTDIG